MSRTIIKPQLSRLRLLNPTSVTVGGRVLRTQHHDFSTVPQKHQGNYDQLSIELPQRRLPLTYDYLVPTPSHLLTTALSDILAPSEVLNGSSALPARPTIAHPDPLPKTHHLIYFPPAIPGSDLLSDGTDPLQSPGPPFVRRMWAGGSVRWNAIPKRPLQLDGSPAVVLESIKDVTIKGKPGDEKVFVGIERRIGTLSSDDENEEQTRKRIWRQSEADFADGAVGVIERRNIVFIRERSKEQAAKDADAARASGKAAKRMQPPHEDSDFDVTVTPDPRLLFRYSALTYNAHAIHLDPSYCREVEGHRGMLVHGPLSFTLLITMLERQLCQESVQQTAKFVEYRNLAPLYCNEGLRLRGKKIKDAQGSDEGRWDVWVETPDGGLAVKGSVYTQIT
ncbi:MAG: hypothetical protein M1828_004234 [Chrysothrix sp. TS-e1954]|nr:MAG: hypothetical protein M1828_004234 [Chrysothrix sp. TS-e1954]